MTCPKCCKECTPYAEDVGIGYTEAWGIVKNHVQLIWLCDLCESEITPPPIEIDWGY